MRLAIGNRRDFWSGVMFAAFGAAFAALATQYDMGTASAMGPGWFPFALGLLLTALGLLTIIIAMRAGSESGEFDQIGWRELSLILLAIALFAWGLPVFGLAVSIAALTFVAALAGHERNYLEISAVAVALIALCYGLFVRGLGLPLPVWPVFLGG